MQYTNLSFSHWHGTSTDGAKRPVIRLICPSGLPCTDIDIDAFYIWTESGSYELYLCENAYGSGPCLASGSSYTATTTTATLTTMTGYSYTTMPGELSSGLGLTTSISIPAVPTTFFPGLTPTSALCKNGGC